MTTQVDGSAVGAAAHFGEDGHDATEESEGVLRLAEDAAQEARREGRVMRGRGEGDGGGLVLGPVGLREGESGDAGDDELVSPAQLQDIVDESQKCHQTDGENRSVVIRHLGVIRPTHSHLLVRLCAYDFNHD